MQNSNTHEYSAYMTDPAIGKPIIQLVKPRFVQQFADKFRIHCRSQCGKKRLSPGKEIQLEREIAYHLGYRTRQFRTSEIDENDVKNADETHFVIDMDNGSTLGFTGDEEVKYADVVSGGEGMNMLVRLSGGRDATIEPPFMVFKNKDRNYPMRGTADNIPGVAYRTGPKGWIDTTVLPQWIRERRVMWRLPDGRKRVLFLDNCSGHNQTEEQISAFLEINTELRYFPPNTTHLLQPCDSFIIQKIKVEWQTMWEEYKMNQIMKNQWSDSSGKIMNPGKLFFLSLATKATDRVDRHRDENGITYTRKAMIMCGLALNTNGLWEEQQLTPRLQSIIRRYRPELHSSGASE